MRSCSPLGPSSRIGLGCVTVPVVLWSVGSHLMSGEAQTRYGHMSVIDKTANVTCNCAAIRQAARRVTRLYDQALAPAGLRITQYPILSWLAATGPVTMNVLAERLAMDRATLGHNLRPLQAQGL